MADRSAIGPLLEPHGLAVLGELPDIVLIGNIGSAIWAPFRQSAEYLDGELHPLDRWTRRVGLQVADALGVRAVFPFDGPPYPPFLHWAGMTGRASPSPISMYIHHEHGLWHAYRFALIAPGRQPAEDSRAGPRPASPCLSCETQPCLRSCPVDAFSPGGFRAGDCVGFLASEPASACLKSGCASRRACPISSANRYREKHAGFHMKSFLNAMILNN